MYNVHCTWYNLCNFQETVLKVLYVKLKNTMLVNFSVLFLSGFVFFLLVGVGVKGRIIPMQCRWVWSYLSYQSAWYNIKHWLYLLWKILSFEVCPDPGKTWEQIILIIKPMNMMITGQRGNNCLFTSFMPPGTGSRSRSRSSPIKSRR